MLTHVEFRSSAFPPYDSEAEEINPGRFGKRLAEFLSEELSARGESVGELVMEDWGVLLPISNTGFRLWIGVGNYNEYPDGFLCFIEPHTEYVRTFPSFWKRVPTRQRIEQLQRRMNDALNAHDGVRDVKWWSYEEFNHPAGA
jgi:hypothetical protein